MEKRRVFLVVAETGHEGEIWVNPNDVGKTLKKVVVEETTIETGEQVLICENGLKIEPNKPLSRTEYHLFDNTESRIFVFDKNLVRNNSLQHRNGILKAADFPIEEPEEKPLDSANLEMFKSVLRQTVSNYEHLFNHHVKTAEVHIDVASKIIAGFERCSVNLRNQLGAAQAVVKNLKLCYTERKRRYTDFFSNFKKQRKKQDDMLNSFESDLQALKTVQLHPELKTPQRETMLDCVPERQLRRWHDQCHRDHEHLCQRVDEQEKVFCEVEKRIEQETKSSTDLDFKALHTEISSAKLQHAEQVGILNSLKKDLEVVRSEVNAMSDSGSSSILSNLIQELEERAERHKERHLPKVREQGQIVRNRIQVFAQTQWDLWEWFVLRIKAASQLQNWMRALDHKVTLYIEGMRENAQKFEQFIKVREMPVAYACCLQEIVKRRAWSKAVKDKITYVKETLEKKRSQEARRRKRFLNEHGTNLPQDFIKGLNEGPTFCEIRMYDLDGCLPEIDSYVDSQGVQRTVASVSLNIKFDDVNGGQSQDVEGKLRKEIEELKARLMEIQHNPSLNLQSINLNGPYGSILPLPRNNPSFSTLTEVSVAVPRFGSIQSLASMNDQSAEIEELKKKNQDLQAKLSEITIGRAKVILENENLGKRLYELGLTRGGPVSASQSQIRSIPQYTEIISTLKAQLLQERVTMQALTETNKKIRKRNSFLENMKQSRSILEISPAKSEILISNKKQLERELNDAKRLLAIANQSVLMASRKISWEKLEPGALVAFFKCSNQHRAMIKGGKNIFLDKLQCRNNQIDLTQPRIIGEVVVIEEQVAEEKNEFELNKGEKFQLVVISDAVAI